MTSAAHPVDRVAIISAVNPYPQSAGKDVVLSGIVRFWTEVVGADNVHYLWVNRPGEQVGESFPVVAHPVPSAGAVRQVLSLATRVGTGRSSIQEAVLYAPSVGRRIAEVIDQVNPDVVIFDTVRMGQYVRYLRPSPGQRRYIYLDDLFSVRYATMAEAAARIPDLEFDALGQFRRFIPGPLHGVLAGRRVQRALLGAEQRLIERSENRSVASFDRCYLINEHEVGVLSRRAGADNVATLPAIVKPPSGLPRRPSATPEFVLMGYLALPHNDDGARWFLAQALPSLLERLPEATVRIVGRDPRPGLVEAVQRFDGRVRFEGYVEDLDELFSRCTALLNPMRFGSGVSIKLLEALARGVPTVTTAVAAHGLASEGAGLLVSDDMSAWPELLVSLTDLATNQRVSEQGKAYFENTFGAEAIRRTYRDAFELPAR